MCPSAHLATLPLQANIGIDVDGRQALSTSIAGGLLHSIDQWFRDFAALYPVNLGRFFIKHWSCNVVVADDLRISC